MYPINYCHMLVLFGRIPVGGGSDFSHYRTKFNRGGQKGLTEAGKPTASVKRSRLIVALIEAVGQPPRLID